MIIVEGNPHKLEDLSPQTQPQVPPAGQGATKKLANQLVDKENLNTSFAKERSFTYHTPSSVIPPKWVTIDFPSEAKILDRQKIADFFKADQDQFIQRIEGDPPYISSLIRNVNDLEGATEILIYGFKIFKNNIGLQGQACKDFFNKYGVNDGALQRLKGKAQVNIQHNTQNKTITFSSKVSGNKDSFCLTYSTLEPTSASTGYSFAEYFKGQTTAIAISSYNKHYTITENLIKNLLNNVGKTLSNLSETSYGTVLGVTMELIPCLTPKYQEQAAGLLKHHWTKNVSFVLDYLRKTSVNYTPEQEIEWCKYAIDKDKSAGNRDLCDIHDHLGARYVANNRDEEATKHFLKALDFLKEVDISSTNKNDSLFQLYYKLALTYKSMKQDTDAVQYLLKAKEISPDHPGIIKSLFSAYCSIAQLKMHEFIETINNQELKKFLKICNNYEAINMRTLSSIKKNKIPTEFHDYFDICEVICHFKAQKQNNQKINEQNFIDKIKTLESKGVPAETRLSLALIFGFESLAKKIIKENLPKELILDNIFQKLSILLDSSNPSAATSISSSTAEESKKVELFEMAGSACLSDASTAATAMNHAITGLKLDPKNEKLAEIGFSAALISEDKEKAQEFIDLLSPEKKIEIAQNYSAESDETEDIQNLINNYDPKKIHQHHMMRKQQELATIQASLGGFRSESSWKIDKENEIKISQTKPLGKYIGLDCWGIIDGKTKKKVGDKDSAFESALGKGIITEKFSKNGVKIISQKGIKNGVELKIDGNHRLFTNQIYVNDESKLLIIFDHEGNHEAVDNFMHNSHLTYIQLSGDFQDSGGD